MNNQIIIRTLDCEACGRYDTVMISDEEIKIRSNNNDMDIGAYSILHNDHTRIVYFDEKGEYLGDTIALNEDELPEVLRVPEIPFFKNDKSNISIFTKLRKKLFSKIHTKNLTISIAGPSRVGKTSLVRYLSTLIPERETRLITSVPTMGKSVKNFKLGSSIVNTLDMGGQQDFWYLWEEAISKSNCIFFIIDATSNNLLEVAKAFEKVIHYRNEETPVLVLLNKKDLMLRGEAKLFNSSNQFLSLTQLKLPIPKVLAIETSIYEGIGYMTDSFEELPLANLIIDFLDKYS
ncbi:MAG: ADP-ribosylation factor-like protein [Candidatus Heimdallarchaeota archaeon]|nr:ADP-ribosylation factor-like protein [Candidatus Heimdallarchaeota archaeon]MDH5646944.1 ADP-ribosylation factor-like protein [Candidatus Heimdallarchaeota archaeon]